MAGPFLLPSTSAAVVDADRRMTRELRDFLRQLATQTDNAALAEALNQLAQRVSALESEDTPQATIKGLDSIRVLGSLESGFVQITLEGDAALPGNTYYYGTGPDGTKGFHAVADAMVEGAGVTLTVAADGTIEIAHADTSAVTDISANFTGGTVPGEISLTFDQFGHVLTRTITGRTLDHNDTGALQGGNATERYHFTADEHAGLLPWVSESPTDYALLTQTITNGDTTHAPSGDAVFDALAGKEPAISAGTTAQFWRGDKVWSDTITGTLSINGNAAAPGIISGLFGLYMAANNSAPCYSQADAFAQSAGFIFRRSNGTAALPTALIANELIGQVQARGYDGVNWAANECAAVWLETDGAWSASSHPARVSIVTTAVGSTSPTVRLTVGENGDTTPGTDNAQSLGAASRRWSVVYAGTGAINTSDAREKTIRGPLTPSELAAARELAAAGVIYQWNYAIAEKGDAARWHFGPTVQSIITIMESHGLDPFRYGFVCYDQWDETPEIRDTETDEIIQEYQAAGDRYSLRHDQLLLFIARGHEERLAQLEAILSP